MSSFFEGHKGTTHGEFSVCQFFKGDATAKLDDAAYEYTRRFVGAEEATDAFFHYCTSVGARLGWTVQVILTDGGDSINMEWTYVNGITYPPEHRGKLKFSAANDTRGRQEVCESSSVPYSIDGNGLPDNNVRLHDSDRMESGKKVEAREGSRGDDSVDEG